ncbi:hypothetical protein Cgig2_025481 [Carnegiea gigantea]|uniref:Uncharacterized protein n=1 Tax=Carnegiea gigantea TaxID=171969 RepID=A0A9Q1QE10_9CARY|nr:hypothetical protein Cgig2_025481 [Carnegiea gigantea]
MSTMTDAIMQQVKKVVEGASSVRPLPRFECVPTIGCEPSRRHDPATSPRRSERMQEAPHANGDGRSWEQNRDHSVGANAHPNYRLGHGHPAKSTTASTLPRALGEGSPNNGRLLSVVLTMSVPEVPFGRGTGCVRDLPMLKWPPPMTSTLKPQNARNYCEFREQNGHTIAECWKLRKTPHELADKGQIDRFLKRGPLFLRKEREPARPEPWDEECSTEIVATIVGGYAEGITRSAWKAQLWGAQQLLSAKQESRVTVPTMVFGREQGPRFTSLYNYPLVVEMKVASAIVQRILINTRSFVDIITWDCPKKLTYPGRNIVPLVHPILSFEGQDVNPIRVIRLPLRFRDKVKAKNLEVDLLVVDVPTAYNIILGQPTLHKATLDSGWRMKLHQLGILALGLSPAAIFQVLNVRLKVALFAEDLGCHGQQELPKQLGALVVTPLITLTSQPRLPLGSEPPLAGAPSLSSRPQEPPFPSSASQSDVYTWPLFPPICGARLQGHVSASLGKQRVHTTSLTPPRPWPHAPHQPQTPPRSHPAPATTAWPVSPLTLAWQERRLPGSLREGLRCALKALLLVEAPRALCLWTREPQPSGVWEQTPRPYHARLQFVDACGELSGEGSRTPQLASYCEELGAEPIEVNLLGLRLHALAPYLLMDLLGLGSNLLDRSIPGLQGRQLRPRLLCTR